jgi:DNA-binding SARP family transcriptional activator
MRVHTVFRTYLLRLLELEGQESERSLRRSYGLLLAAEGYFEDAVVQLVSAGDTDAAVHAIESALPDVVRRMDFEVAEHWLDLLQRYGASHHPEKVVAELMIAAGREQYWRVVQIFDEMPDEVRESVLYRTPAGAAIVAWGYWHLGRIADARAVFSRASECRETAIMRATFGVSDDVSVELPAIDTVSPALLDPLLPRIAYYCGRFGLLEQTVLNSRWAATVASAWLVGGLRATGRTHEALEHYERTLHEGTSFWLQAIAYPETLHDLDRKDEAWEALLRGRELSHQDGSQVHRVLSLLLEAKFHLRFGGDSKRARLVLDSVASIQPIAEYAFLRETRLTLQGFADLLDKQVGDAARQLSDAARSMRQGGRLLHLPTAEVLLSQALWELGDEDGSEAAADRALAAATAQGSNFLLLQALGDVPDVGTRSIDAEDDPDGPWHALGRALLTHVSSPVRCDTASVRLHDLGELRLTVAGEMVKPRIRKSLELVAYLIGQPDEAADRRAVLDALFDGRDDASTRSYLRQAVHRLREVLPPGIEVSSDKDTIQLVPVSSVDSDVRQVTRLLDQAASQRGEVRLRLLEKAIALAELGDYAADVNSDWAVARRDKLATDLNNTRYEAAVLAYRLGRYRDADGIVSTLLECDPYREQGWQLAMRLASTLGAVDRVTSIYRRCRSALAEIGLQPSAQTEQAFQESR